MNNKNNNREKELLEKYTKTLTVNKKRNLILGIIAGVILSTGAGFAGGYFATKAFAKSGEAETIKYIVEFETNGGDSISAVQIKKGDKLEVSKYQPTKKGCLFDGWYLDSELTTLCPKQLEVTQNTKIYAKWKNKISDKGLGYILNSDGHSYSVYMADEDEWSTESSVGQLVIPDYYQGKPITSIGYYDEEKEIAYGFQGCLKIFGLDFTNCIATQIAPYAFKNCFRFANGLNLSSSITSIGTEAFANCLISGFGYDETKVIEIGDRAFINNYVLTYIDENNFKNLVRIGKEAFANCYQLSSVHLNKASSLLHISESCFENCAALEDFAIPASIIKISANAFKNTSVKGSEFFTLEDTISTWSKEDGTKLETTEEIKNALSNGDLIYKNSFHDDTENLDFYIIGTDEGTGNVDKVSVANPVNRTDDKIIIPSSLSIEYEQQTYTLNVTRIAEYGFSDSKYITKVTIPSSVNTIGANAFQNCSKLKTVEFADSNNSELIAIGDNAFKSTAITGIDLPNGLLSIGDNAFCYTNIESINIPNTVTEIKDSTIFNSTTKQTEIHAPFFGCDKLHDIIIENPISRPGGYRSYFTDTNNVLFTRTSNDDITLLKFPEDKECDNNTYELDTDTICIGNGAFYNANKISKIVIPENTKLKYIYDYAFSSSSSDNKITSIEINNNNTSLEYIGYQAFAKTKITSFNMPSSVKFLGGKCFEGCSNYKGQEVEEGVYKFVIPESALYIDTNTITGCSKILTREQVIFDDGETPRTWTIYKDDGSIVEKEFSPFDSEGKVTQYAFEMLKGERGNRYWVNDEIPM